MFAKKMAVDLGSANTLLYQKSKGIILAEPSVVAINYWDKKAIAVGKEAKGFMGRTPKHIKSFRPLKDGLLVDFKAATFMLEEFFKKINGKKNSASQCVFTVPTAISPDEKKALGQAGWKVGCKKLFFLPEVMAAALGAGLDVGANRGRLIINIGGSTCEVAVVINSTVTFSRVTSFAGDAVDDAIIKHLREEHGVHIGENTAEKCKIAIAAAEAEPGISFSLTGKDMKSNAPRHIEVESGALGRAISEPLHVLADFIRDSLATIAAQHRKDAKEDGILLVGGGSLLSGLESFLKKRLGLEIVRDNEPLTTVIRGAGMVVDKRRKYRKLLLKK